MGLGLGLGLGKGTVVVVPEILGAFFHEAIGEGLDVLLWGYRVVSSDSGRRRGRRRRRGSGREGGANVGANACLVELLLLFEESSLFVSGTLLVHTLPLPLVHPSRKCARTTSHVTNHPQVPRRRRHLLP